MCCWLTMHFQLLHTPVFEPEKLWNGFSQRGAFCCCSIKEMDSFVLNKEKKQEWWQYCCRGVKCSSMAVRRLKNVWVWWDASIFFCFPLLECGRIPARLPARLWSKSEPLLAEPELSVWASHFCKVIYLFFKGFCSVFGFVSVGPHSAALCTTQISWLVRFYGCLSLYKHVSALRLMNNILIFSELYGV